MLLSLTPAFQKLVAADEFEILSRAKKAGADGNRSNFQNQGDEHELQLCEIERAAQSGAFGAENGLLSVPDDPRLLALIDAWAMLSEDARDAAARLARADPDDAGDASAAPVGKAVSR